MKIVKKILLITVLLLFISCKPAEKEKVQNNSWAYIVKMNQYTVFTEEFLGINFCKIKFIDIIEEFRRKNINFQYYSNVKDCLVKYTGEKTGFEKSEFLETTYFVGTELDKSKILQVTYEDPYKAGGFRFTIKFKEEYYDTLLCLLGEKLGTKNANYNRNKYNETSWNADPDHAVPTCISSITMSKKLRYDEDKKGEKGVCYLEIKTRPRSGHVP